ncbi:16S rRNA (cytidine(1402)-2'-O)-methyltransferase [Candidatus Midichloria mitochondrii]|nr:16S rRNA (cytidine(1402)-2'-O)-methyltransferase [Candidatus Midichloria mitochondrii]MDJ1288309.1 16S rRNA (cytidine(1402)-2'-O)-methyltransferase [Candidatus Midichloria mitochondrii]
MFINQKLHKIENHILSINSSTTGKLYIISTPIGNIKDMTIRALDTLKSVCRVVCEDTRITAKLLLHYGIKKPMVVFHDHSSSEEQNKIINYLLNGEDMALVSDAGTPLISDPGYGIVNTAIKAGIKVTAIPGPCSAITALTLSGLPTNSFMFIGFLPNTLQSRLKELISVKEIEATLIFFETAKRLLAVLHDFLEVFGNRKMAIGRELTKLYEEVRYGNVVEQINYWQGKALKGEFVLILEGAIKETLSDEEIKKQMTSLLNKMSFKDAISFAKDSLGISKKKAYEIALQIIRD